MKIIVAVVGGLAIFASQAIAQTPTPAPVDPAQVLTFTLSAKEADQVGAALAAQPYKDVAPLLDKLRSQVIAQQHKDEIEKEQKDKAATESKAPAKPKETKP